MIWRNDRSRGGDSATDLATPGPSDTPAPPVAPHSAPPLPVKIVIAGGFGAGKTTAVGAISDIAPLTTEAAMTTESIGIDRIGSGQSKRSTTVAFDFGRVQLSTDLMLYLFGSPGQDRFRFLWDELLKGAIGAVVLVDTTKFEESFGAVSHLERSGVPFVVVINPFDGNLAHHPDAVREALDLPMTIPVLVADARDRNAVKGVLMALVRHAMACVTARPG